MYPRHIALLAAVIAAATFCFSPHPALAAIHLGDPNTVSLFNGLVGYWTFDGPVTNWNTNTTLDISGNGNTGQMINMSTTTSPVAGKIGQALQFDGSSSYVGRTTSSSDSLDVEGPITISAWVRVKSTLASYNYIVSKNVNSGVADMQYALIAQPGGLCMAIGGVTSTDPSSNFTFPMNTWVHAVGAWDGTYARIYVNGNLVETTSLSPSFTHKSQFSIGRRADGGSGQYFFPGTIDDVRIYNRALSPGEVKQLYALGTANAAHSNTVAVSNGLVGYWTFDGGTMNWTNNTTADVSGNGNTGQMINMSTTTSPVAGKIGQALNFNGSNYVDSPSSPSLEIGGSAVSVFAWVKPSSFANYPTIISKNFYHSDYQLGLDDGGGKVRPCLIWCVTSNGVIPINSWSHIGFTYDGSYVRMYINGKLDSASAQTGTLLTDSRDSVAIGNTSPPLTAYPFTGVIDDVRVYNRTLSAGEVKQLYALGRIMVCLILPTQQTRATQ